MCYNATQDRHRPSAGHPLRTCRLLSTRGTALCNPWTGELPKWAAGLSKQQVSDFRLQACFPLQAKMEGGLAIDISLCCREEQHAAGGHFTEGDTLHHGGIAFPSRLLQQHHQASTVSSLLPGSLSSVPRGSGRSFVPDGRPYQQAVRVSGRVFPMKRPQQFIPGQPQKTTAVFRVPDRRRHSCKDMLLDLVWFSTQEP